MATLPNDTGQATVSNGCGTNTVTQSPATGTVLSLGAHVVTLNVTDSNGSSSTCTFSVTVADQTAPSITCPANTTVAAGANCSATLANYAASVTATDNCTANPTETQSPNAGTTISGTQVVTLTATDAAGNTSDCSFSVSVTDNTLPTITCPLNIVVGTTGNQCNAVAVYTSPVGTDNCSGSTTVRTAGLASGSNYPVGVTTNIFRVTDASGNTATCSFTVTVTDQTPPTVTCPANTTVSAGANCVGILGTYSASASDNCTSNPTPVQNPAAGTAFTGSQVVTFSANDAAGNTGTCTFTVIVSDQTAPGITCPANTTVAAGANCSATLTNYAATVTATDNCAANPNETQSPAAGTTFTGSQVVTLTATDAAGNTATCSFLVTVADQTAPSITCPANTTIAAGANCTATLAN